MAELEKCRPEILTTRTKDRRPYKKDRGDIFPVWSRASLDNNIFLTRLKYHDRISDWEPSRCIPTSDVKQNRREKRVGMKKKRVGKKESFT